MLVRKKIDLSADQNSGSEIYKRSSLQHAGNNFFSIFLFSRQTSLKRGGGAADSLTKLKVIIDDDDDTSNYNYA